jgi:hypothetical protein
MQIRHFFLLLLVFPITTAITVYQSDPIEWFIHPTEGLSLINSSIGSSPRSQYSYGVTDGVYEVHFKSNPSSAESILYIYNSSRLDGNTGRGGSFTFQPLSLEYTNALDQLQLISTTQSVSGIATENFLLYPHLFGSGIGLTYHYLPAQLKEVISIGDFTDLPLPEDYIINGEEPHLKANFLIDWDDDLSLFVDNSLWDSNTISDVSDVSFFYSGEEVYRLNTPYANSFDGDFVDGSYTLKKQGNKIHLSLLIPYSFLATATYPVHIDPTVIVSGINDEGRGGDEMSGHKRVFHDYINERTHVLYLDSGDDVHSASAPFSNLTNWTDGTDLIDVVANIDQPDFDAVIDQSNGTPYIHAVSAAGTTHTGYYNRCQLTATSPFISCPATEESFFILTDHGHTTADDLGALSLQIDTNRCLWVSYFIEDDTEATADEFEIGITKENASCGDGDWDSATDHASGFPQFDIQTSAGFNDDMPTVLRRYDSGHLRLSFHDTDGSGSIALQSLLFNITSNLPQNESTVDNDIEANSGWYGNPTVVWNESFVAFGWDDNTFDVDAYQLDSLTDITYDQTDTTANSDDISTESQNLYAVVNTLSDGNDDIILFTRGREGSNQECEISYTISPDGGTTWQNHTLWIDACTGLNDIHVKYFSAALNNQTCTVDLLYQDHTTTTDVAYEFDSLVLNDSLMLSPCNFPTAPDPGGPNSCQYSSGDFVIDCTDNCDVNVSTDVGGNDVYLSGDGDVTATQPITNFQRMSASADCHFTDTTGVTITGG